MTNEENPEDTSLLCNLAAMTPTQRAQYETQKQRLREAIEETQELPNGYAFRFASAPNLLIDIAQFMEGERHCCPFYTFTVEAAPSNGPVWLRITGPQESKTFIKDALTLEPVNA